jgi:hypothetical protein
VVSATQMVVYVLKGHDFSRAINGTKRAGLQPLWEVSSTNSFHSQVSGNDPTCGGLHWQSHVTKQSRAF